MHVPAPAVAAASPRLVVTLVLTVAWALAPLPAVAEPDAIQLGKDRGYPVGSTAASNNWYGSGYRVGSWSAMDQVRGLSTRTVPRAGPVTPLPAMSGAPVIQYRWRNIGYTLDEYLERQRVTGLLILKDGRIVAERYRYGRTEDARFLSFSMAKTVTSMLVGIAQDKGLIASLDDRAEHYDKELAGTAYGATTVRQLLRMSSGLTFTERYDGNDDSARMARAATQGGVIDLLRTIKERHDPAGEKFVYASAETEVLGRVVTAAAGRPLADLTSEWLWQPLGAERDAFWVLARDGRERASGFFNASLRDWGRLGLLLARDGRVGDRQVLPRAYLMDATDAARQPSAFRPRTATPYLGYGYQTWLFPLRERTFGLQGVFGQAVFVQPSSGIVMVQTAAYESASGQQNPEPLRERNAFWLGVLRSLGGSTD